MEYKVRQVGGLQTCDISLPVSLIQTLDSTYRSPLPPVLALELRPLDSEARARRHPPWVVAWCGAASSSGAIEIAQEFAECINLPDGVAVVVRALPNVPEAVVVTIEPLGEDDWEVVGLMAEAAEAVILKQVRIIHQTMKFPLWLHGHSIVTFCVVSTDPTASIVQLVPGTKVAVAPKTRKRSDDYFKDSIFQSLDGTNSVPWVLLRVQAPKDGLMQKSKLNDHDVEETNIELLPENLLSFCNIDSRLTFQVDFEIAEVRNLSRLAHQGEGEQGALDASQAQDAAAGDAAYKQ